MSFSTQHNIIDGWASLNTDLFMEYVTNEKKFQELCEITTVCKSWFNNIAKNITGQSHCKLAGIKVTMEYSWMSEYRKYLRIKQLQFIAFNVSDTMDSMCGHYP